MCLVVQRDGGSAVNFDSELKSHFKGSRPEWCISSMIYSRDLPFSLETLDLFLDMHVTKSISGVVVLPVDNLHAAALKWEL